MMVEVAKKQRLSELIGILKTNKTFQPVNEIRKEAYPEYGGEGMKSKGGRLVGTKTLDRYECGHSHRNGLPKSIS